MKNTEVPKEKSQSALYFKARHSIGKLTTPLDEGNPAGVWRDWTFGEKSGRTYELQTDKIQGDLMDARVVTNEFENKDGKKVKETSLLIGLREYDQVRVLQIPVKDKYGLSKQFKHFARRCESIEPQVFSSFEFWLPPGAERYVFMYKQDVGEKWPAVKGDNYWNKTKECYEGLPEVIVTEDSFGEKEYDSKEQDAYLKDLVMKFCERVQASEVQVTKNTAEDIVDSGDKEDDSDVPF